MSQLTETPPTMEELIAASAATPEFRAAVLELSDRKASSPHIQFSAGNPPVKVLRVILGLIEAHPGLAIDTIAVSGQSGCSDYRGTATVNGSQKFEFVWDCAWKAEQVGWKDFMGYPDQQRAARTFGHRCFQVMRPID